MVSNHDVLIATASIDREAASEISVYFADVSFPNMKLFGRDIWKRGIRVRGRCGRCRRCGLLGIS